jgi:hypothetical protein
MLGIGVHPAPSQSGPYRGINLGTSRVPQVRRNLCRQTLGRSQKRIAAADRSLDRHHAELLPNRGQGSQPSGYGRSRLLAQRDDQWPHLGGELTGCVGQPDERVTEEMPLDALAADQQE